MKTLILLTLVIVVGWVLFRPFTNEILDILCNFMSATAATIKMGVCYTSSATSAIAAADVVAAV